MKLRLAIFAALIALGNLSWAQSKLNLDSVAHFTYPSGIFDQCNDIWGYVDSLGNEYALVGKRNGLSVVSLADTNNLVEVFSENAIYSVWRDIKTWGHYAYVTNESGGGLAIYDLSTLPDSVKSVSYYTGNNYFIDDAHNIYIDENGVAYLFGSNGPSSKNTYMLDVATNPGQPIELGVFDSLYLHDGFARGDTLYGSAVYAGLLLIIDVSDKSNPQIIGSRTTPSNFTHNCWPNDNSTHIFTTDEVVGGYVAAYDITNVNNIVQSDRIRTRNTTGIIPHNAHVLNDYVVTSYYTYGVSIIDGHKPDNLVEVGYFDTSPNFSGGTFDGNWGAYPFLPSGLLILSDIQNGLFVLRPQYGRASYLEGDIKDCNGNAISQVDVTILESNTTEKTNLIGNFKMGTHLNGYLTVLLSKSGYQTQRYDSVLFVAGQVTNRSFEMLNNNEHLTFHVEDPQGAPLAGAKIELSHPQSNFVLNSDVNGDAVASISLGKTDVKAGLWGFAPYCNQTFEFTCATIKDTITLIRSFEDNFSTEQGWQISGTDTNAWTRVKPIPTFLATTAANPGNDADSACGGFAYVTGNGKNSVSNDDIDKYSILASPQTDLSQYVNPQIQFEYWFSNLGVNPNDNIIVAFFRNSGGLLFVDTIVATSMNPSWTPMAYNVLDYMPASNFRNVAFIVNDNLPDHIVEAGIDNYRIVDQTGLGIAEENMAEEITLFPNPFQNAIQLRLSSETFVGGSYEVYDVQMKKLAEGRINQRQMRISLGDSQPAGLYFFRFNSLEGQSVLQKVLKN